MPNGMRLLPTKTTRSEPWAFPVYSAAVIRALVRIRKIYTAEEQLLEPENRRELADALQILALAAHLESQIALCARDGEHRQAGDT